MVVFSLVGLVNAGKSTLFNSLICGDKVIVSPSSGVTRDNNRRLGKLYDFTFEVIDTGGKVYGPEAKSDLFSKVEEQVRAAVEDSDVILFVVDGAAHACVPHLASDLAKWIVKNFQKPVILIANKCDLASSAICVDDIMLSGFYGPVYISAEHRTGYALLYNIMRSFCDDNDNDSSKDASSELATEGFWGFMNRELYKNFLKIAIVGRPNSGKSMLLNSILGFKRAIVSDVVGTTRDPVHDFLSYHGHKILLVDTAGIRKKSRISDALEGFSVSRSYKVIEFSDVVVLVVDSLVGLHNQDSLLFNKAIKFGKGIVIALNKWDLCSREDRKSILDFLRVVKMPKLCKNTPLIPVSALNGSNCLSLLDECISLKSMLSKNIKTAELNSWLRSLDSKINVTIPGGKRLSLKYATQISSNPLKFLIYSNFSKVRDSHMSYFVRDLKDYFAIKGVPVKIIMKVSDNPYI